MSKSSTDFSDWIESPFTDTPLGGVSTDPTGLDIFESFKDGQGRYRTQSLFIETPHDSYPAYFTTKRYDVEKNGKKYHSLYLKYMEIGDPTEYQVAKRLFGSWQHWEALCKAKWFTNLVAEWREELKVRMASERYFEMIDNKDNGGAVGVQATKWLHEHYADKKAAKRGRPSKAEKEARLKAMTSESEQNEEDAKRLQLI